MFWSIRLYCNIAFCSVQVQRVKSATNRFLVSLTLGLFCSNSNLLDHSVKYTLNFMYFSHSINIVYIIIIIIGIPKLDEYQFHL
jgi:hypothetical protein